MTDVAEGRRREWRFCLVFALLSVTSFVVLYAAGDVVVHALNRHIAWTAARARALGWGLGLLTLTQVAFLLVTFEFWQQMPVPDPRGGLLYLPGHSALGLRLISPLYYFFEIMGRGLFALLVYFALLVTLGGPGRRASGVQGSRGPAPRRRR